MILSKSSEKVVWELNELLAAQQRARNFSRATLNGEIDARPNQFVPQSWDNLSESAEHAGAEYEDTHVEEVVQTAETLAEEAYKRGFEEGHAAGVQEELARAQDSDRAFAAIFSKLDALPPMWSQLVDLSLEVAEVTSLGVLSSDLNYMRDFINKTLVKGEIDPTQLVSIKVSEKIYMMLQDENNKLEHDGRELPVEIDTSLADLDVGVEYEFASIERRFSEQLSQVRDQLLSQVPFAPVTEDDD
jgi:flagellar biosynthesis/type III secretory pathway protein FliH